MKDFEFSENNIADLIVSKQKSICTSYDLLIPKCYTSYDNECDLLAIRKSGLCDEIEIKISRTDFFNDAKKKVAIRESRYFGVDKDHEDRLHYDLRDGMSHNDWKKLLAPWEKNKYEALNDGDTPVNYFWYAIKEGIVEDSEIPDWAGIIKIHENGYVELARYAKKLKKEKLDINFMYQMARKLGYRYWDNRLSTSK